MERSYGCNCSKCRKKRAALKKKSNSCCSIKQIGCTTSQRPKRNYGTTLSCGNGGGCGCGCNGRRRYRLFPLFFLFALCFI